MNNDLISREALKQAYFNAINETSIGEVSIIDLIDNAPTVEPDMDFAKECYANGYEDGKNERPQGEWKTNLTTGDIFCSCCKEVRRDTRIKHINFCNSCGADMRKGGEEE